MGVVWKEGGRKEGRSTEILLDFLQLAFKWLSIGRSGKNRLLKPS